jgi:hypothetical protein
MNHKSHMKVGGQSWGNTLDALESVREEERGIRRFVYDRLSNPHMTRSEARPLSITSPPLALGS